MHPDQDRLIEQLYHEYFGKLTLYASAALRNQTRAQDVVQDTFHEAIRRIDTLMGHLLDTRMVISALKKAFKVAKPQILNSDQGCQFTSQQYIDFVKENGIRQSMDGKSRWADNIMIERWFRSFKYEEAYLTQYNNIREARAAIGQYIHTYNFVYIVK